METENKVSVWLGNFKSQGEFEKFIEEVYDEDSDDMSSKFMDAFEIDWIDHDFIETSFEEKMSLESLNGFSYMPSFIHNLTGIDFSKYNCILLAYDFEYDGSVTEAENMKFIGAFDYVPDPFDPSKYD